MDPTITAIGSVIALIIGNYLKRKPEFLNKNIPYVTFVISFLTQLIAASTANASTGVIEASIFGGLGGTFLNILKDTLIQTFLTTGIHSAAKNTLIRK